MSGKARKIEYDWYPGSIPANVVLGKDVYLDSSYGFARFRSKRQPGLTLRNAAGAYDRATIIAGEQAQVVVGDYSILNGSYLISEDRIAVGRHCLLAWGVVVTDCWDVRLPEDVRRQLLQAAANDPARRIQTCREPRPVTIQDNVWVGFDSVILPGVTLGRGCIVGCKVVIGEDVPPYAVVVGNPAKVLRYLDSDDDDEARRRALAEYSGTGKSNNRVPAYEQ